MYILNCTYCENAVYKSNMKPKIEDGAPLYAQEWLRMDNTKCLEGDEFYCNSCGLEFQPLIERVEFL